MRSLRMRMMVAVGVLALSAVLIVALAVRQRTRAEFRRFRQLETISRSSGTVVDPEPIAQILGGRCCDANVLRAAAATLTPRQVLIVTDESGRVIAKAGKPLANLSDFRLTRQGDVLAIQALARAGDGVVNSLDLRFHLPGTPMTIADGSTASLYVLPFPDGDAQRPEAVFLGSIDRSLLLITGLIALVALAGTWMLTKRIAEPIEELRTAARDLGQGDLRRRAQITGSDEIADLGRSFNIMAAQLEKQQMLRRNLVHDVVHELRTPITALRCRIDSVVDGIAADPRKQLAGSDDEIAHLERLVDDLHELALAEARELKFDMADAALAPAIESAVRAARLDNDQRLERSVDEGLVVRADKVRVRQVLLNILSNAARYTPADGKITIRVCGRERAAVVEVHNTGSSLTADEIARVFDRFYRVDPSRQRATGGTGLGLAIVKNLVEAQGGRVWAETNEGGVTFGFALPRASGAAQQLLDRDSGRSIFN